MHCTSANVSLLIQIETFWFTLLLFGENIKETIVDQELSIEVHQRRHQDFLRVHLLQRHFVFCLSDKNVAFPVQHPLHHNTQIYAKEVMVNRVESFCKIEKDTTRKVLFSIALSSFVVTSSMARVVDLFL